MTSSYLLLTFWKHEAPRGVERTCFTRFEDILPPPFFHARFEVKKSSLMSSVWSFGRVQALDMTWMTLPGLPRIDLMPLVPGPTYLKKGIWSIDTYTVLYSIA